MRLHKSQADSFVIHTRVPVLGGKARNLDTVHAPSCRTFGAGADEDPGESLSQGSRRGTPARSTARTGQRAGQVAPAALLRSK
jgi:hypothetical protein